MNKEIIKLAAIVFAFSAALSSCSGNVPAETSAAETTAVSETTADETEAASVNYENLTPEEYRQTILENSIVTTGNTERLLKAFKKAENGEEITAAYIGGSITEGIAVEDRTKCWAKLNHDYLCESFPDTTVNYVNAGMSGTPSTLAVIRAERDVLEPFGDPDIVFIEFAVNDAQNSICKEAYESLVRRMLDLPSEPAVVLLFMRTDIGYNCQKQQSQIGYHYGLPMISLNDALTKEIDEGRMSWSDYSDDGAHPNLAGNALIADMMNYFYECVKSGKTYAGEEDGWDKYVENAAETAPLFGDDFVNTHLLDRTNLTAVSLGEYSDETATINQFPNGWTRKGGDNEGISFDIECKSLFVVYHCNKNKKFGTAEVYVDGERLAEVKSNASDGWSNPVPLLVMRSDELKKRRVEVKMAEGNENTYFGILGFGYTD